MGTHFSNGHALLIGVGATAYKPWSLPATASDVHAIKTVLTDASRCCYLDDPQHVRVLSDSSARLDNIRNGLLWLRNRTDADPAATAVVYFSGHGWLEHSSGRYFLLPHDVDPLDISGSALNDEEFTASLRQIKAQRLLVMIDACHAQGIATAKGTPRDLKLPPGLIQAAPTEAKGMLESIRRGEGRAVFSSSRGSQKSWVRSDGTLSIFTHHLLEALQGAANRPGDTEVRLSNLMGHLGKQVPVSARQMQNAEQIPYFDTVTEDFAVALLRAGKGLPDGGWEACKPEAERFIRTVSMAAHGDRSVAIGKMTGGTIITGDQTASPFESGKDAGSGT